MLNVMAEVQQSTGCCSIETGISRNIYTPLSLLSLLCHPPDTVGRLQTINYANRSPILASTGKPIIGGKMLCRGQSPGDGRHLCTKHGVVYNLAQRDATTTTKKHGQEQTNRKYRLCQNGSVRVHSAVDNCTPTQTPT